MESHILVDATLTSIFLNTTFINDNKNAITDNNSLISDNKTLITNRETLSEPAFLEDTIFGSIMISYSLLSSIPYILCLYVFATDPEIRSKACYRIIFFIGVADIFQLLSNGFVGGLLTLLRSDTWATYQVSKRVGSILESNWMAYSMLINLLAFNRCVQVCRAHLIEQIFSKKNTSILIGICWLYGCVWFIVYNIPQVTIGYDRATYIWGYTTGDGLGSETCNYVEMGLDLFQLLCTIVWYICILVTLRLKAQQMSNSGDIAKQELSVLMQSFCVCLLYFGTCFGFFVVPVISSNRYVSFVSDLVWLVNCSFNPVIYLAFNKRLRGKVRDLILCCKRSNAVGPVGSGVGPVARHAPVELTVVHALSVQRGGKRRFLNDEEEDERNGPWQNRR